MLRLRAAHRLWCAWMSHDLVSLLGLHRGSLLHGSPLLGLHGVLLGGLSRTLLLKLSLHGGSLLRLLLRSHPGLHASTLLGRLGCALLLRLKHAGLLLCCRPPRIVGRRYLWSLSGPGRGHPGSCRW